MSFRITGLAPDEFSSLFSLSDETLAAHGVRRVPVTAPRTAPCRITLTDAAPGETVLLLNYEHQPADTPFRARHAIYVREIGAERFDAVDQIPDAMIGRPLSVRAFDGEGMMVDAGLTPGENLAPMLEAMFARDDVAYVQIHYALRGCYAARAERVN